MQWIKIIGLMAISLALYQCAQIVAPTGGAPDEDPPVLDTLKSFENFQLNFEKQDIILQFDEWVELKKPRKQIIISPDHVGWKTRIKGKSVIFSFGEDELREDITYIINFGEAIVDLTEGNAVPNFRIVFSTGDFIDSLSFNGNVKDALTGETVENAVVMLHDNLSDTAVTTIKPLYLTRTDKLGNFKLENLKSDTFQVFAILDKSENYIFEPLLSESIAFQDSLLLLAGKNTFSAQLYLSAPLIPLKKRSSDISQFGRVAIGYNQKPEGIEVTTDPPFSNIYSIPTKDSLLVWYNRPDTSDWKILLAKGEDYRDTVEVTASKIKGDYDLDVLPKKRPGLQPVPTNPFDTFRIELNYPLVRIDSTKVILRQDSLAENLPIKLIIDSEDRRNVLVSQKLKAGVSYELQLLPGALVSILQRTNDTIAYNLQMQTREDLSNFTLNLLGLDSTIQYVFTLKDKGGVEQDKKNILGKTRETFKYPYLLPGEYSAKLIIDKNKNGRWDPGDLKELTQPEKVTQKEFGKFLPNFDRSEDWQIEDPEK